MMQRSATTQRRPPGCHFNILRDSGACTRCAQARHCAPHRAGAQAVRHYTRLRSKRAGSTRGCGASAQAVRRQYADSTDSTPTVQTVRRQYRQYADSTQAVRRQYAGSTQPVHRQYAASTGSTWTVRRQYRQYGHYTGFSRKLTNTTSTRRAGPKRLLTDYERHPNNHSVFVAGSPKNTWLQCAAWQASRSFLARLSLLYSHMWRCMRRTKQSARAERSRPVFDTDPGPKGDFEVLRAWRVARLESRATCRAPHARDPRVIGAEVTAPRSRLSTRHRFRASEAR